MSDVAMIVDDWINEHGFYKLIWQNEHGLLNILSSVKVKGWLEVSVC